MEITVKTQSAAALELQTGLSADDQTFAFFCEAIRRVSGISLKSSKYDLLKARIRSRLSELGMSSYEEYKDYLSQLADGHEEWQTFINLLTTNKTDFFREPKHFDFITNQFLPQWLKTGEKTLRVWSAAASSGEEPYTLAMILSRILPKDRDFKILATDIDTDMIGIGSNAVYPLTKKVEIPVDYHKDCLDIGRGEASGWFRIKSHLKEKVVFKRHNLIEKTGPQPGIFDLVFCRNVFIYFSPSSIEFVTKKLFLCAKVGGHLFIGHSESLQSISHPWQLVSPSIFRKDHLG